MYFSDEKSWILNLLTVRPVFYYQGGEKNMMKKNSSTYFGFLPPYERHFPIYTFLKMAFSSDGQRIIIKQRATANGKDPTKFVGQTKDGITSFVLLFIMNPLSIINNCFVYSLKSCSDELHPDITKGFNSMSYKLFEFL